VHPWLTKGGEEPLPLEEEHCTVVEVTEEEVKNSVKTIPSLPAVVCINHNRILLMVKAVWRGYTCTPGMKSLAFQPSVNFLCL